MTTTYQPAAIPAEVLAELRERDDAGATPSRYDGDTDGLPLRCCLRGGRAGEDLALVAYAPLRRWAAHTGAAPGAYDEVGPVFIHLTRCAGPDPAGGYPVETAVPRVVRRYTDQGRIAGGALVHLPSDRETAQAVMAGAVEEAFTDPEVALVHVRAVEHGCFQYEVRRP